MWADQFNSARMQERAEFLQEIAIDLLDKVFQDDTIILRLPRIHLVAKGYFILNACYKNWRIEEGHYTQDPKIAAIQCMSIATFEPFRPVNPTDAKTVAEAKSNEIYSLACEIYSLACAAAILEIQIDGNVKHDFYLRLLDVLSSCRSETLEPYLVDVGLQINRPLKGYVGDVHANDKFGLDSLITIFELFCHHFKY